MIESNESAITYADKILKAIKDAKELLNLKDNFDDEGSKAITQETLNDAFGILGLLSMSVKKWGNMYVPSFGIGPDSSVDILWVEKDFYLAVNIPEKNTDKIFFYGVKNDKEIKGEFNKTHDDLVNLPKEIVEMISYE